VTEAFLGVVLAVIDADKLLDDVLRKRNFRGKTMGERLVAAQRSLSDNDAVWYAHKLRNRLVHEPEVRLKKNEAQNALAGFKKGLHDLGAM
jgi:sensor domain CHASE-containing protein